MTYQRKLTHVISFLETQNKPQETNDIQTEGNEAMINNDGSKEILLKKKRKNH